MRALIHRLGRYSASLKALSAVGVREETLFKRFSDRASPSVSGSAGSVLVQCVEDPFYLALFGQIAHSLRQQKPLRVEQYVLRSLRVGEADSLAKFIRGRWVMNRLLNRKWQRLYGSFCNAIAYRSTGIKPLADSIDFYRAWRVWVQLADRDALRDLQLNGIPVGDLVNDSYLRFRPAPSVRLNDPYLLVLIWQAYRDIRRAERYFRAARPMLYLTSYSTYIQHGVPVRIALKHGAAVYAFGNIQEFSKKLSWDDWYHTKNPETYAAEFERLAEPDAKLAKAEQGLATRLSGGVDAATRYMRQSAYSPSEESVPDVHGAVIVFLHDFYDSPHVYADMVFADFWEWIGFTADTLNAAGISFFVKPHPNQISLSEGVMQQLLQRYPDMRIIPARVTNRQLVDAGMICAVTVYGTVAHEMAYMGVPSIACARHPHVSFDFCNTSTSKQAYAEALRGCLQWTQDRERLRRQSLAFYYMHNLNLSDNEAALRDWAVTFRVDCASTDVLMNAQLDRLEQLPAYRDFVAKCLSDIQNVQQQGVSNVCYK